MNRIAIFLTFILLAAGVTLPMLRDSRDREIDFVAIAVYHRRVQEMSVNYGAFKATFDETINALKSGEINLREAESCVRSAAETYHPSYLIDVQMSDPGETIQQRVARNLMGHVGSAEELEVNSRSRLPQLELEFVRLFKEHRAP
jgi:hypothetical protein